MWVSSRIQNSLDILVLGYLKNSSVHFHTARTIPLHKDGVFCHPSMTCSIRNDLGLSESTWAQWMMISKGLVQK